MANYIFFGAYALILLSIFGFIVVFLIHIRDYRQYSSHITIITRIYLIVMICIAIFGGYYVLSGSIFPQSKSPVQRINL